MSSAIGGYMDVRAILLLAAMAAGSASAQQVHKCVEGGKTSYQSAPCANSAPQKTWDATPQYDTYENQLRLERIRQDMRQRDQRQSYQASSGGGVRGVVVSQYKEPDRCQAAKDHRDAVYRAAGIKRSFELSRQMDDKVYAACK
ncbi:hypothetical protein [Stenotrophomonas rhizophila]